MHQFIPLHVGPAMRNYTDAPWVDPSLNWKPIPVTELPERVLIDYATKCNLRCPMCPVWGSEDEAAVESVTGVMDVAKAQKMLDEMAAAKPLVQPCIYGEPLLIPDFQQRILDMKSRGMTVAINTNGLVLTDEIARFLVENKVDSIFFSVEGITRAALEKVRGVDKMEKIEVAIFRLLLIRGGSEFPRIGVTMTVQDGNRHEEQAFVDRWAGIVDCVRVGLLFDSGTFPEMVTPQERTPCPAIYNTLPVHNDGTVALCCLDGFLATKMGNVFEEGVQAVWQGEEFAKARYYHETGQWDKVPFCKSCNGWAQHTFEEEIRDGLLIRRSPQYTYYNRIARLGNWKGRLLGDHPPPPQDLGIAALEAAE